MSWTHEHSWKLPAPPERVFKALTDSSELSRWFAEHTDLSIEPGGDYRFWGRHTLGAPTQADPEQVITRLEPGTALGFTWKIYGVPTSVTIALAAEGDATRLTLHHEVADNLPVARQKELIDDHWRLAWPDWRGDKSVTGQKIGFYLESAGRGTRVTSVHSGFGRTADLSDLPFGWVYFLGQLRLVFTGAVKAS